MLTNFKCNVVRELNNKLLRLIKKLEHYGIRGVANSLLKSYLNDRKQFVSIANTDSSDKVIDYGVPQGSILGPLLFLIYINDLPSCLQTLPRFFADDTALSITAETLTDLEVLANTELSNVLQWMRTNGLLVNTTKTEALLISPYLYVLPNHPLLLPLITKLLNSLNRLDTWES